MNEQVPALPPPEPPVRGPSAARLPRLLAAETDEAPLDALAGLVLSLSGPDALSTAPRALDTPARAVGEELWQICRSVVRRPLRFLLPVPRR